MKKQLAIPTEELFIQPDDQAHLTTFSATQASILKPLSHEDFKYFSFKDGNLYHTIQIPLSNERQPVTAIINRKDHYCHVEKGYLANITEDALPYTIPLQNGGLLTITIVTNGVIEKGSLRIGHHLYKGTFTNNKPFEGLYYSQHPELNFHCVQSIIQGTLSKKGTLYRGHFNQHDKHQVFYTGDVSGGVGHGTGQLLLPDRDIQGTFIYGKVHGNATCTYRHKDPSRHSIISIESDNWVENSLQNGSQALITYRNGDTFSGHIKYPTFKADRGTFKHKINTMFQNTLGDSVQTYTGTLCTTGPPRPKIGTGVWYFNENVAIKGSFNGSKKTPKTCYFSDRSTHLRSVEGPFSINGHNGRQEFIGTLHYKDDRIYQGLIRYDGTLDEQGFTPILRTYREDEKEIVINSVTNTQYTSSPKAPTSQDSPYKRGCYNQQGKKTGLFEVSVKPITPVLDQEIQKIGIINYAENKPTVAKGWFIDPSKGLARSFYSRNWVTVTQTETGEEPNGHGISIVFFGSEPTIKYGDHKGWQLDNTETAGTLNKHGIRRQPNAIIHGLFKNDLSTNSSLVIPSQPYFSCWSGPLTSDYQQTGVGQYSEGSRYLHILRTAEHDEDHGPTRTICYGDVSHINAFSDYSSNPVIIIHDLQYTHNEPDTTQPIKIRVGSKLQYIGSFKYEKNSDEDSLHYEYIPHGEGHLINLITGQAYSGQFKTGTFTPASTQIRIANNTTPSHVQVSNGSSSSKASLGDTVSSKRRKSKQLSSISSATASPLPTGKKKHIHSSSNTTRNFQSNGKTPSHVRGNGARSSHTSHGKTATSKQIKRKYPASKITNPRSSSRPKTTGDSQSNRTTQASPSSHTSHGKTAASKRKKRIPTFVTTKNAKLFLEMTRGMANQ